MEYWSSSSSPIAGSKRSRESYENPSRTIGSFVLSEDLAYCKFDANNVFALNESVCVHRSDGTFRVGKIVRYNSPNDIVVMVTPPNIIKKYTGSHQIGKFNSFGKSSSKEEDACSQTWETLQQEEDNCTWTCVDCTLSNQNDHLSCEVCGRPRLQPKEEEEEEEVRQNCKRLKRSSSPCSNNQQIICIDDDGDESRTIRPDSYFNLSTRRQIIYLDLDNWANFFQKLPSPLPRGTFVHGFFGGRIQWREPRFCNAFTQLCKDNGWKLHDRCIARKDAADFALALRFGQDDQNLPRKIPFTVFSGDGGFRQLLESKSKRGRQKHFVNPHYCDLNIVFAKLASISDQ